MTCRWLEHSGGRNFHTKLKIGYISVLSLSLINKTTCLLKLHFEISSLSLIKFNKFIVKLINRTMDLFRVSENILRTFGR